MPTGSRSCGPSSRSTTSISGRRTRRCCAGSSATPRPRACLDAEPHHALATLGEVLLTPTRIYARDVLAIRAALAADGGDVRGIAHITGGGLPGNVPRALPADLGARLRPSTWPMPSVMRLFGELGGIEEDELRATFNGGLGMVMVVPAGDARRAVELARERGIPAWVVGEVVDAADLGGHRYAEAA